MLVLLPLPLVLPNGPLHIHSRCEGAIMLHARAPWLRLSREGRIYSPHLELPGHRPSSFCLQAIIPFIWHQQACRRIRMWREIQQSTQEYTQEQLKPTNQRCICPLRLYGYDNNPYYPWGHRRFFFYFEGQHFKKNSFTFESTERGVHLHVILRASHQKETFRRRSRRFNVTFLSYLIFMLSSTCSDKRRLQTFKTQNTHEILNKITTATLAAF